MLLSSIGYTVYVYVWSPFGVLLGILPTSLFAWVLQVHVSPFAADDRASLDQVSLCYDRLGISFYHCLRLHPDHPDSCCILLFALVYISLFCWWHPTFCWFYSNLCRLILLICPQLGQLH